MKMKRQKIVYGVYGDVERIALIPFGRGAVQVEFRGGSMTTQGVTPATYSTSDAVIQLAIERSEAFRTGKIKRVRVYDLGGEVTVERNSGHGGIYAGPAEGPSAIEDTPEVEDAVADAAEVKAQELEPGLTVVSVGCVADAAEYLRENYGIALSKLRKKETIEKVAASYGIEFEYCAGA